MRTPPPPSSNTRSWSFITACGVSGYRVRAQERGAAAGGTGQAKWCGAGTDSAGCTHVGSARAVSMDSRRVLRSSSIRPHGRMCTVCCSGLCGSHCMPCTMCCWGCICHQKHVPLWLTLHGMQQAGQHGTVHVHSGPVDNDGTQLGVVYTHQHTYTGGVLLASLMVKGPPVWACACLQCNSMQCMERRQRCRPARGLALSHPRSHAIQACTSRCEMGLQQPVLELSGRGTGRCHCCPAVLPWARCLVA